MSDNRLPSKPNFWQILVSVLGALIGVQSAKVRERDFSGERPWWVYVIVGMIVVAILVVLLLVLTKYTISSVKSY